MVAMVLGALDVVQTPSLIAIILSATGLGAIIPVLRGAGLSATPVGQTILIVGPSPSSAPCMLLSILFAEGDSSILDHVLFFGIFAGVTAVVWFVLRRAEQQPGLADRLEALEGGTAQIRIRLAVLVLAIFLALSSRSGSRRSWAPSSPASSSATSGTTNGAVSRGSGPRSMPSGSGSCIPIYFVISGLRFDLRAAGHSPSAIARVPLFLVLFLVCRGVPALLFASSSTSGRPGRAGPPVGHLAVVVLTATDVGMHVREATGDQCHCHGGCRRDRDGPVPSRGASPAGSNGDGAVGRKARPVGPAGCWERPP